MKCFSHNSCMSPSILMLTIMSSLHSIFILPAEESVSYPHSDPWKQNTAHISYSMSFSFTLVYKVSGITYYILDETPLECLLHVN